MKKSVISAIIVTLTLTGAAWAQCGSKATAAKKKACDPAACKTSVKTVSADCKKSCSKSGCNPAACSDMLACCGPKMKYSVAGETLCCEKNAEILAKAHDTNVKFVVADQTFEKKGEAMTAYADALEQMLSDMTTVKYAVADECVNCPMAAQKMASKKNCSVKYRVAAWTFDDKEQAKRIAEAAREAAQKVKMETTVDGKKYCCAKTAAKVASTNGKQCEYKVGDKKTCCKTTAKVNLTLAKLEAAQNAARQQQGA